MFHLARGVKWHPHTAKLSPTKAWAATCKALTQHGIEPPDLGEDLFEEDGAVDFVKKWEKARFPFGGDPVVLAFEAAGGEGCLQTHTERPGRYSLFLTMAALLQLERGSRPILLPVYRLGEVFGCRPKTASAWIGWATEDGVLRKVAEHVYRPGGKGLAAEYFFGLHRWKVETIRGVATRLNVRVTAKDLREIEKVFDRSQPS